jgi:succinate dehydrogenase / fumarate reductase, cytochrome b subunit
MASRPVRPRPKAPHLFAGFGQLHYRWSAAMLVSILHRATGATMACVGAPLFVWWLVALAGGEEAYATFANIFTTGEGGLNLIGYVVGIGLTFCVFQHAASGVRHLVLDVGAAYELKANRLSAALTIVFSVLLTVVFWLWLGVK